MTNEAAGLAPTPEAATGPVLALQSVYLKDCSYEAPNGPRVEGNWNPQINLDLHTAAAPLAADVREIVLTVTVSAKQNDSHHLPGRGEAGRHFRDAQPVG